MGIKRKMHNRIARFVGTVTRRYYFEDYVRVYPDGITFNRFGRRRQPSRNTINNFLNHCKFYKFAAQFVKDKRVADIGCGSGYGCKILKQGGAALVCGSDISKQAIKFAQSRYGNSAEFTVQGITEMKKYSDDFFDVSISSEVLEHIKEYGKEGEAIKELKRITRVGGLIIIGTPNSEMLHDHGFSFDEISTLFQNNFSEFRMFENALVPFGEKKRSWEKRLSEGEVGVIISERINLAETVLPDDVNPEMKKGVEVGHFKFSRTTIDTTLLHNTHSWIIIAVKD